MGKQIWKRAVGVAHRRHEERHDSTGEDGNIEHVEDNDVDHCNIKTVQDCLEDYDYDFTAKKEGHLVSSIVTRRNRHQNLVVVKN